MNSGYDQFFKNARKAQAGVSLKKDKKVSVKDSNELAQQLRAKMSEKKKKKSTKVPWKMAGYSFVGLVFALFGFLNLEKIEKAFHSVEISLLGKVYAEEKPTTAATDSKKTEPSKDEKAEADKQTVKKEFTQDEINHLSKLNERKKDLDAREQELVKMEAEIQAQKVELEKKLVELEQTRKSISQVLEERVQADDKKIDTLVQVYSNMKPQQAAKIFETLDEDLAVEILGKMKKKNAAEIMNLLKSEKAQVFSERYAGYKRK